MLHNWALMLSRPLLLSESIITHKLGLGLCASFTREAERERDKLDNCVRLVFGAPSLFAFVKEERKEKKLSKGSHRRVQLARPIGGGWRKKRFKTFLYPFCSDFV